MTNIEKLRKEYHDGKYTIEEAADILCYLGWCDEPDTEYAEELLNK